MHTTENAGPQGTSGAAVLPGIGRTRRNLLLAIDRLRPDLPCAFSRLNFEPRTHAAQAFGPEAERHHA